MSETGGPSPEEIFGDLSKAREGDPITKSAGQEALKSLEGNLNQEASPKVPDKDMQAPRVAESPVVREVVTPKTREDFEKQYQEELGKVITEIKEAETRNSPDKPTISAGPDIVVNSGGKSVTVKTLVINNNNLEDSEKYKRTVVLTATDEKGNVVGYRRTGIGENSRGDSLIAGGTIQIKERGGGYARYLEIAKQEVLTRIATERGLPIRDFVIDNNSMSMDETRKQIQALSSSPEDIARRAELEQKLSAQEQEHQRWEKMWGPGGKLGYDGMRTKLFKPSADPRYQETLTGIGQVQVTVQESEGKLGWQITGQSKNTDTSPVDALQRTAQTVQRIRATYKPGATIDGKSQDNEVKKDEDKTLQEQLLERGIPGTITKSEKLDVNGTPVTRETVIGPDGKPHDRLVVTSPVVVDLQKGLRPEDFTRLGGSLSAVQALVDREVQKINLNPDTSTKQEPSSPVVWRVPQPDGSNVDVRVQVAGLATTRVSPGSIHGASPNVEVPVAGGEIRAQRTLRKGPNPMGVDTPDPKLGLTKDAQEALRSEGDKVVIAPSQGRLEVNGKVVDANKPLVLKTQEAALVTVVTKGPDGKPQTTLVRLVPRAADPSMNSSRYAGEVEASQSKANKDLKYLVTNGLSPASGGVIPPDIGQKLQEQEARQIRAEDDMEGLMESLRGDRYTPDLRGSGRETMDPRTGEMKGESRYPRPETRQTPAPEIPQAPNIRPLTERVVTRGSSAQNPKIAEAFQPEEYRQPDLGEEKGVLSRAAGFLGGVAAWVTGRGSKPEGANDQRPEPQRRAPERQQEAIGDVQRETPKGTEVYQGLGVNPRVAEWYKQQGIGPQEAARLEEALKDKLAREGDQRALQGGQERENRKVQSDQEARTSMAQREAALERGRAEAARKEAQNQGRGNANEGARSQAREEEPKRPAQAPLPDSPAETNKAQGRGLLGGLFGGNRGGSERDSGGTEPLPPSLDDLPPSPQAEIPDPSQRIETPSGTSVTGIEDYTPPAPSQSEIDARNKYLESLINQGNEEEEEKKPPLVGSALPETPVGRAARDTQAAAYSPAMRNMPSSERKVYIDTLEKIRRGENLSITDQVLAEQLRQMGREMSTKEADPLPEYPPVSGRVQNPIRPVDTGKYSDGGLLKGIIDDE